MHFGNFGAITKRKKYLKIEANSRKISILEFNVNI